jgi:hypothetical protein
MVQAPEDLRLVLEPLHPRGRCDPGVQHLQRHAAPRRVLLGQVHDAHAALAEDLEDPVAADPLGERHRGRRAASARRAVQAVEPRIVLVGLEERGDLRAQLGLATAFGIQELRAPLRLELDRAHEQLARPPVQRRVHGSSLAPSSRRR